MKRLPDITIWLSVFMGGFGREWELTPTGKETRKERGESKETKEQIIIIKSKTKVREEEG